MFLCSGLESSGDDNDNFFDDDENYILGDDWNENDNNVCDDVNENEEYDGF